MRTFLLVPALAFALLAGLSSPVSAAGGNANCIGVTVSSLAGPGFGNDIVAPLAMHTGVGSFVAPAASSNNCSNLP